MECQRLLQIMAGFESRRVVVLGDFFLDKYLDIDRSLAETSLETGLEAHQVVRVRTSPGGAGNVAANLRALRVGVEALTVIGDDGEGYELLRELHARAIGTDSLLRAPERFTPTYTKPMLREVDGRIHELSRLDIKNRAPLPADLETAIIERLHALAPQVDAIIVADQVQERNYGVVTDGVRQALMALAAQHPQLPIVVDSRMRAGEYRGMQLKPNDREALRALGREHAGPIALDEAQEAGCALSLQTGQTVFVTVGEQGVWVCSQGECERVAAVPVTGEIDIVGAGDSALAGIVAGLSCEATPCEAALIGNLVSSVTIRCLGTTGTASQEEVVEAWLCWRLA